MNRQVLAWFEYFAEWFEFLNHRLNVIEKSLGNPVDNAKVDELKKRVDDKRVELQKAIDSAKP